MWPNLAVVICSNITCVIVLFTEKALGNFKGIANLDSPNRTFPANRLIGNKFAVFWYISLFSVHVTLPVLTTLVLEVSGRSVRNASRFLE